MPQAAPRPPGWARALLRLWTLRPLRSPPAGSATRAIVLMSGAWLLLWLGIDRRLAGPAPTPYAPGVSLLAWYALWVIGLAALLRWRVRSAAGDALRFAPLLCLVVGAVPWPVIYVSAAPEFLGDPGFYAGAALVALYLGLYFARGLHALSAGTQRGGAALAVAVVLACAWLSDRLDVIPDVWAPADSAAADAAGSPVDAEALLFEQPSRIDAALDGVRRGASSAPESFFLGFAGVGEQKVFAEEIGLAGRVLAGRFGFGTRKLALINDVRDLDSAPLATVSGLRYALQGIAGHMNLERDVLFLALSSHGGANGTLAVSNADLPLDDLTDEDLAEALSDAGIKWRVIVISACYAGGFIPLLRDSHTIVIAAAAADRTSFGCSNDRDLTYFGEAFYRDALPGAPSLRAAFETAKAAIAERERREHVTPSEPQAWFGADIEAKLTAMGTTGI